ncbi:MAG: hypothetical protein GYB64_10375 [Chloroflexi bacterium]|nr:hypothetical protein [Chloroflexota bacterium]
MENIPADQQNPSEENNAIWIGVGLIALGLLFFLGQFIEMGVLFVALPGLVMMVLGIVRRSSGWMIPGGILLGVALGIIAMENQAALPLLAEANEGGIFLLAFALGWGSITVATLFFGEETHWWPLIPGGIMALIGGALLAGEAGEQFLQVVGNLWPVVLIIIGAGILFGAWRGSQQQNV